jgi:hypothetical protein
MPIRADTLMRRRRQARWSRLLRFRPLVAISPQPASMALGIGSRSATRVKRPLQMASRRRATSGASFSKTEFRLEPGPRFVPESVNAELHAWALEARSARSVTEINVRNRTSFRQVLLSSAWGSRRRRVSLWPKCRLDFFLRSAEPNLSECVQMAVSFGCPSSMLATESASDSV